MTLVAIEKGNFASTSATDKDAPKAAVCRSPGTRLFVTEKRSLTRRRSPSGEPRD